MIRIAIIIALCVSNILFGQSEITTEHHTVWNDSIQLPGTLTFDATLNTQPLVIFVQGSGNPDRHGNQLQMGIKANYIKMLRDRLNQKGIAFYSFDKRNVTEANSKFLMKGMVFEDLVADVTLVISKWQADSRFHKIIVVGHSQGSLVGMLALNEHVDQYISLAGLGGPMETSLIAQLANQNKELAEVATAHIKELKTTGTIAEVHPFLIRIFAKPNHEFLSSYFAYDPSESIQQVTIPILIINGDMDSQIPVAQAQLLHEANTQSELVIIPQMNHVLKHVENDTDNYQSYYTEDFPLAKGLVDTITAFIKN